MNVGSLIVALSSAIMSAKAFREAFKDQPKPVRLSYAADSERVLNVPGNLKVSVKNVRTIDQRVYWIEQMIRKGRQDPRIRAIAVQVVSRKCNGRWCIPERDYLGELKALFDFTRQHVRYVRDPIDRDTFTHPVRTLQLGGEDCDGGVIVIGSLAQAIGYPFWMRVIQTTASSDWDHIYGMAGIPPHNPTRRVPLDVSVDRPAFWEAPRSMVVKARDFPVR